MTHFTVVVFDDGRKVDELLAKYDENLEVPQHSEVVEEERYLRFYDYYTQEDKNASSSDLELRKKLNFDELYAAFGRDWNGMAWKKNDGGVWEEWSTYNPDSKYDYYTVVNHALPGYVPFAFVTPDGVWHEKGHMGWWAMTWGEMPDEEWNIIWQEELGKYHGKFTILDCHI